MATPTPKEASSPSLDSLCYSLSAFQQLARQGSWRSLIDAISQARKLSLPQFPHEQLIHHTFLVLSHMKLRNFSDASMELELLSDLDSPQYQYEQYPDLYPHREGSMVPFVLRWLHAELPNRLGQTKLTIERLYALYDRCQKRIESLRGDAVPEQGKTERSLGSSAEEPVSEINVAQDVQECELPSKSTESTEDANVSSADADSLDEFGDFVSEMTSAITDVQKSVSKHADWTVVSASSNLKRWEHRQEFIINCILSHHLNQRDFMLALKWFKILLVKHPSDPWLYSKLAYAQMQFGDVTGAAHTFSEVEKIVQNTSSGDTMKLSSLKGLVCRNKAIQHVVNKEYAEAIKEFDAALAINPADIISANNKALCYMYSRDLIGSTKVLESILDKAPLLAVNESLVLNLCSMYELAFVHNHQTKKNLSDWIQQIAPGDFDLSCTRL